MNNLVLGNPQEMPLLPLVDSLQRNATPRNKDWFAYKFSEPESQSVVAASLRDELGIPFEPEDIALTTGAFGALSVALQTVVDPGDEVIINLPPWSHYEALTVAAGGVPVKIMVDRESFDLDLEAIAAAITPRTRVVIVNTPNNPTGKIYPKSTLERLATILEDASARNGRRIYLISDEPYRKIIFEDTPFTSPLGLYPYAMMTYSYGKVTLAPGQRIGYLALSPDMPDRPDVRKAIRLVQIGLGFLFPNALLQHALPELESMSIDIDHLRRKRDRLVGALQDIGYDVHVPEGTFYVLPRSPLEDDMAFIEMLADRDTLCLPGSVLEFPGFFRVSLTASDEMIERAIPVFADVFRQVKEQKAA
ncbi:MAG TPA: aminotransferase class I/II-fold pyridoxal phosphate-dependent enzyme [Thermomicrobiales bacterium]|nr:aminotransferase class I/II-fold pyridoxal phosphate-dependent enzyme [Thermomicrobiales bacterium]